MKQKFRYITEILQNCGISQIESPPSKSDWESLLVTLESVLRKRKQIDNYSSELAKVLFHIDEMLISIDKKLNIKKIYSPDALSRILDLKPDHHLSLEKILLATPNDILKLKNWLQMIDEPNRLKRWDKYAELCPIKFGTTHRDGIKICIQYTIRPMLVNKKLKGLLIVGKDITKEQYIIDDLNKSKEEKKVQMDRILALAGNNQESLSYFFQSTKALLKYFSSIHTDDELQKSAKDLFIKVHTLKGEAGSLGFTALAQIIEKTEDLLDIITKQQNPDDFYIGVWLHGIGQIRGELEAIENVFCQIFERNISSMYVHAGEYQRLLEDVSKNYISDQKTLLRRLSGLRVNTFADYCKKYANLVQSYRKQSGKNIADLVIENAKVLVHDQFMKSIDGALVHLIRNALDHGIESNEERQKLFKGMGQITLKIDKQDNGDIAISVCDNGKGMDPKELIKVALEKNIIDAHAAKKYSVTQALNLIFHPGFSTKSMRTELSGRGIGMSAVKKFVEDMGGRLEVKTEIQKGSTFIIFLNEDEVLSIESHMINQTEDLRRKTLRLPPPQNLSFAIFDPGIEDKIIIPMFRCLVLNFSYGGAKIVLQDPKNLTLKQSCRIVIGKRQAFRSEIVWLKNLSSTVILVGLKFLEPLDTDQLKLIA